MSERSEWSGESPEGLGALLLRLHDSGRESGCVEVVYRVWRHQERLREAFAANVEERKRRGASISTISFSRQTSEPEPPERVQTVRIWRDGERARVEHHGRERDGYYAVVDPPLWWMWESAWALAAIRTIRAWAAMSGTS